MTEDAQQSISVAELLSRFETAEDRTATRVSRRSHHRANDVSSVDNSSPGVVHSRNGVTYSADTSDFVAEDDWQSGDDLYNRGRRSMSSSTVSQETLSQTRVPSVGSFVAVESMSPTADVVETESTAPQEVVKGFYTAGLDTVDPHLLMMSEDSPLESAAPLVSPPVLSSDDSLPEERKFIVWIIQIIQIVMAAMVGSLTFWGFGVLWSHPSWHIPTFAAALVVHIILVAVARYLRRREEFWVIIATVAVGFFITVGPLAFFPH